MEIAAFVLLFAFIIWLLYSWRKRKVVLPETFTNTYRDILEKEVVFYEKLDEDGKAGFEKRMLQFLEGVKITGVNTVVTEEDKVFVAASAIIPIFGFASWQYNNLNEVLLYPGSFNKEFDEEEKEKSILGMVGDGSMHRVMVLSQDSLRQGFRNKTGKENTGIHEFVHLLDKTDGAVDGLPENMLDKQHLMPWLKLIHENIKKIMEHHSDINPYGATNEAEFFAVVSEYFFERPDLLQSKHPDLYELLQDIFRQDLAKDAAEETTA